jgi:hypothetical protein
MWPSSAKELNKMFTIPAEAALPSFNQNRFGILVIFMGVGFNLLTSSMSL